MRGVLRVHPRTVTEPLHSEKALTTTQLSLLPEEGSERAVRSDKNKLLFLVFLEKFKDGETQKSAHKGM